MTVPAVARPYQGKRAGVVTRVLASAVDFALVFAALVGLYAGYAALLFLWKPRNFHFPSVPFSVAVVLGGVLLTGYLAAAWSTTGRTYGDHLLGLRVVRDRGGRLAAGPALARALLCAVFPLGLFWSAVNRRNRSVQDILMRTTVVYDWTENGSPGS